MSLTAGRVPLKRKREPEPAPSSTKRAKAPRGYNNLPFELRLKIAKRFAADLPRWKPLAGFACVDRAWKHAVEAQTFGCLRVTVFELPDFKRICVGRRRRLLRRLALVVDLRTCMIVPPYDPILPKMYTALGVGRLFRILKRWTIGEEAGSNRVPGKPLDLQITFDPCNWEHDGLIECNWYSGPVVNVVTGISHPRGFGPRIRLHEKSTLSLMRLTPNVTSLRMEIAISMSKSETIRDVINFVQALVRHEEGKPPGAPKLTDLDLASGYDCRHRAGDRHVIDCDALRGTLTTAVFEFTQQLQTLTLCNIVDVERFFCASSERSNSGPAWPTLRSMHVKGIFKADAVEKPEAAADFFSNVTRSLPSMPRIESLTIAMMSWVHENPVTMRHLFDSDVKFWIEFLIKPELHEPAYFARDPRPVPDGFGRLSVCHFVLTAELVQEWEDAARAGGADGLMVYRGAWTLLAGLKCTPWEDEISAFQLEELLEDDSEAEPRETDEISIVL